MKIRTPITIIATLAVTSNAFAATLIEQGNFSYDVEGDLQIQFLQNSGVDEDLDINFDDGELKNRITYDLGSGLKAFGQIDFNISDDDSVGQEEAYVGMTYGPGTFLYGSTVYVTDDFGIENSIDVGNVAGDAFPADSSDDVVSFGYELDYGTGTASIGLSTDLEVDDDPSSIDLLAVVSFGPAKFGLAFQSASNLLFGEDGGTLITSDADTYGISAKYDAGVVTAGVAFSSSDIDNAAVSDTIDNINVVLIAPVLATTDISLGYETIDVGDSTQAGIGLADTERWYANVTYEFPEATDVTSFFEIGQADIDGVEDLDVGFLAGLRLQF